MNRNEILAKLRAEMSACGMSLFVVLSGDYHGSEYISDHFRTLRFLSGFTGEGALVVTPEKAFLVTDGRYFLQGEKELAGADIRLTRMGTDGIPAGINEAVAMHIREELPEGGCLGFDGRIITLSQARLWEKCAVEKGGRVLADRDPAGLIWADRPAQSFHPAFLLPEEISGESTAAKLARVREAMAEQGATHHILTSLDDIAWLLNVRGSDVPCNPVVFSFVLLSAESALWYADPTVGAEVLDAVRAQGFGIRSYEALWDDIRQLPKDSRVLLDENKACYFIKAALPEGAQIISLLNPTTAMKCIKNESEIAALRRAHVKDGIAMVKFLYWLKQQKKVEELSEIDAADYLEQCRRSQGAFDLSFTTIAAMGPNASVIHYSPKPDSFAMLAPEGFFLVDSGAQFKEGTTDITRTIAMGPLTEAEKKAYTAVLRSILRLGAARFREGCTGYHLDILARGPLWDEGLDYRHGTGHGVGFCLNVHEGPNAFRWAMPADRSQMYVLAPGMITTDEPGYYADNAFGVRIENDLLCVDAGTTEYGRFLAFEHLTLCPIDLTPVIREDMEKSEIKALNAYHEKVYQSLKDGLNAEEAAWLREVTLPL